MYLPNNTFLQGGKYKIIRFINSGGFGCTYEAEHVMLEMRVAIKEFFIKDFCNRDEKTAHVTVGTQSKKGLVDKLRRKFIEEAKALTQLHHPNIVRVIDVFEENGTAYFVMDYIEGRSLNEIVNQEGPLSEVKALKYIREIANALQYVHKHHRLHLDVKPGNIMINKQDNAILIDFGASKQYDEENGENTSTLLGKTPGYAPLEQIGNDVVKFMPATDIYSLGATLYKLLTGITPLSANLLASGEILKSLPTSISVSTRKAIKSAMNIDKNKRPQNIEAFLMIIDGEETNIDSLSKPNINNMWRKYKWIVVSNIIFIGFILIILILPKHDIDSNDNFNNHIEDVNNESAVIIRNDSIKAQTFAEEFLYKRLNFEIDTYAPEGLEKNLQNLIELYKYDATEFYEKGDEHIHNPIKGGALWHIGNDCWEPKIQLASAKSYLSKDGIIFHYKFDLYYGENYQGVKEIKILKENNDFKVYDIKTDNSKSLDYSVWIRDALAKYYHWDLN